MKDYAARQREEKLVRYIRRTWRNKLFATMFMVIWSVMLPYIEAPIGVYWTMSLFILFTFLYPERII